jgi:hypothetical protein
MRFRDRRKILIASLAMGAVVALPAIVQAEDAETKPSRAEVTEATASENQVSPVLTTLPVLGSGLSLTIAMDDSGAIDSVGLDPADGTTTIKDGDHTAVFLLADGSTELIVKASGNSVQTKVKADATADAAGPGSWAADLFGNGVVTIPYTVAFDGNTPSITLGEIVVPAGVIVEVGEAETPRTSDENGLSFYKVSVKLTSGEDCAAVNLEAKTLVSEDGELLVAVSASLSSPSPAQCQPGEDDSASEVEGQDPGDEGLRVEELPGIGMPDKDLPHSSRDDSGAER